MFWTPQQTKTTGRSEQETAVDSLRDWAEPAYVVPLYALGLFGALRVRRRLVVLLVALLAYQTLAAMAFAGATRYRAPWDFAIALVAGAGLLALADRLGLSGAMGKVHPSSSPRRS
jgi:hypothetical protein